MEICSFRYIVALFLFANDLYCAELKPVCEMVIDYGDSQRSLSSQNTQTSNMSKARQSSSEIINPNIPVEVVKPTPETSINELCIKPKKHLEEHSDKTVALESGLDSALNKNGDQKQKLIDFFNGLNNELSAFTKFYDYYDVLTFIDKSIALIQELECLPEINKSRNSMIQKKMIALITCNHKNLEDLYDSVEKLYKKNESIRDKFNYMIDGLTDIKKRKEDLKKQFERYSKENAVLRPDEYQKHDCLKLTQLKDLREDLEKLREKICPVDEQDLQNNAENYKNAFKKKVSDIYKKLFECHEKEKRSLKVLFDVYKNILEGIKDAIARLNSFNDDLTGSKSKAE